MLAVIQRVSKAEVVVDGEVVGKIDKGLLVYAGVAKDDTSEDVSYMARKVSGMRIFEDEQGKLNKSVQDVGGEILLISNFTLQASCKKGNRPSFNDASPADEADKLFNELVTKIAHHNIEVQTGKFGAHMDINSDADGPVNIILDSRE